MIVQIVHGAKAVVVLIWVYGARLPRVRVEVALGAVVVESVVVGVCSIIRRHIDSVFAEIPVDVLIGDSRKNVCAHGDTQQHYFHGEPLLNTNYE
jgi:hypothetical protein